MRDITAELQENVRDGRRLLEALRDVTPGRGRYQGVTADEIDRVAERFAERCVEQGEITSALYAATNKANIVGRTITEAAFAAAFTSVARRHGARGVIAFVVARRAIATALAVRKVRS